MRRRELLAGAAAASVLGMFRIGRAEAVPRRVRNVIFLVADGMSSGVPALAEMFSRQVRNRGTVWSEMRRAPGTVNGYFDMASLNSPVTDSAAASSSWGSGSRVRNGMLNMLPDGRPLRSLIELAGEAGYATGVVTTATVTHATPAGFIAQADSRQDKGVIANQYLNRVDIALGGNSGFAEDPDTGDDADARIGDFRDAGYAVCGTRDGLLASTEKKILGLFRDGMLPFTIDTLKGQEPQVPTLAEMARVALDRLSGTDKGFVLQIEAARVDHAAHLNDIGAQLWDQLAFDDALAVARGFADGRDDTLMVVCTDHGNSNPGLNGVGLAYSGSGAAFAKVADATVSFEKFLAESETPEQWSDREIRDRVIAAFGWELESDEAEALRRAIAKDGQSSWNPQLSNAPSLLAELGGRRTGIGWTGRTHTADWAEAFASGTGAEAFHGLVRNDAVFGKITSLLGIDFKNPRMTPEEAAAITTASRGPVVFPDYAEA